MTAEEATELREIADYNRERANVLLRYSDIGFRERAKKILDHARTLERIADRYEPNEWTDFVREVA